MNTQKRTFLAALTAGTIIAFASACVPSPPTLPDAGPTPMPGKTDGEPKTDPSGMPNPDETIEPDGQPGTTPISIDEACVELFNSWFQFTSTPSLIESTSQSPAPELAAPAETVCTTTFLNLDEVVSDPDTSGWDTLSFTLVTDIPADYTQTVGALANDRGLTQVADENTLPGEEPRLYGAWAAENAEQDQGPSQPKPSTDQNWTYGEYLILAGPDISNYEDLVEQFTSVTGATVTLDDRILIHGTGWYPELDAN